VIWQKDLFLCDSCLLGAIREQQDFLSFTLSAKTGDRPRKFSYGKPTPELAY
jgi:hypothetical protein